ncbi:MAG: hypothetical protein ACRDHP_13525 [Ktedonobacterales bacterium]
MSPQRDTSEMKHEIQAAMAARRELGPEYDDHFLNALVEKLTRQPAEQRARPSRLPQRSNTLDASQRMTLAICSLIFGIPLVAISGALGGPIGLIVVCCAILGINFAASR